jgi:hypothetical protein
MAIILSIVFVAAIVCIPAGLFIGAVLRALGCIL